MIFDCLRIRKKLAFLIEESNVLLEKIEYYESKEWEASKFLNQVKKKKDQALKDLLYQKKEIEKRKKDLEILANEKSQGFPYLAEVISDYFYYKDLEIVQHLKRKKYPALKASEQIKEYAIENRELRRKLRVTYSKIRLHEYIFPFITDLEEDDIDFLLKQKEDRSYLDDENIDPVRKYVPEYDRVEDPDIRNQKALDRYLANRNKSNWEIGKM